jgi:hypothetical protein
MQERPHEPELPPTQPMQQPIQPTQPMQPTQPLQPIYGYAPYIAPQKPKRRGRTVLIIAGSALGVLVVAAAVGAATTKTPDTTTRGDTLPIPVASGMLSPGQQQPGVAYVSTPPPPPAPSTSSAPPVPQQVTYSCTGSAPDGVDITYGPNGSNHSASKLPFKHTEPLDTTALYYVTTAQLQGGGSVSCTTVVQTDDGDGTANQVTSSGSADGGYNIASAEVCGSFDGGWDKC